MYYHNFVAAPLPGGSGYYIINDDWFRSVRKEVKKGNKIGLDKIMAGKDLDGISIAG